MSAIFTIKIFSLENPIRPNYFGPPGFPLDLEEVSSDWGCYNKFFSTRNKAITHLKEKLTLEDKEEIEALKKIIYIRIDSQQIDSNKSVNYEILDKNLNVLINGKNLNKPFNGGENKYSIGDWVIYFEGARLLCGIIGAAGYTKEEINQ